MTSNETKNEVEYKQIDKTRIVTGIARVATIPPTQSLKVTITSSLANDSQFPFEHITGLEMTARAFQSRIVILGDDYDYELNGDELIIKFRA